MSVSSIISELFSPDDQDLKSGPIKKTLILIAFPLVINNLLQTAYNIADTIWIGQYSTDGLAAISFAFPMVFLFLSLGIGLSIAGSVLVAQRMGAGDEDSAKTAASQALFYSFIGSILLGGIGFFSVNTILRLFGASNSVLPLATDYMQIISAGLPFLFVFIMFSALSRGSGDTITPMTLTAGSVFLNILIDPILIFGFQSNPLFTVTGLHSYQSFLFANTGFSGYGISGAAYATIFSRSLATIIGVYIMFRSTRSVSVSIEKMKPKMSELKELLNLGVPSSTEMVIRSVSVNLMLPIVGLFPTTIVAGYGVGIRIFSVVFLPAIAISQAVETVTGQNYGARNIDRLINTNNFAMKLLFASLLAFGMITWVLSDPIAGIFTNDAGVKAVAKQFLLIVAPTFAFTGIVRSYSGGLRGIGKTELSALIALITLAVLRLPLAYILSTMLGPSGIWYSFAISNIFGAALAYILFRYTVKSTH